MSDSSAAPPSSATASDAAALAGGVVRIEGRDALRLLHDISTQQLLDLKSGDARLALFCDFRGRLLHRVVVARVSDGSLWLIREDAPGASLAAHLDRSIFREEVRLADLSASFAVVPGDLGGEPPGESRVIENAGRPEWV